MTWLILLFFAVFGVAYLLRRRRGKAELEAALEYRFSFEADEVFRGEYLTLCQTVINRSARPIPFLKLETLMPEGLELVLAGEKTETVRSAESIWTLRPEEQIERRWRVLAKKRGIYAAESVELHAVSNDPLGANEFSLLLKPAEGGGSTLRVLPCAVEEIRNLALTAALTGDASRPQGILRDPMAYAGVRAYTPSDPLGSVDWKQSAKLGYPVVRQCEAVRNDAYQVVLNMQTVLIEPHPPALTSPQYLEECITVCASLLDSAAGRNIPVRLFANTDPAGLSSGSAAGEDGIAANIFASEEYRTGDNLLEAYRTLAELPPAMSVPVEQMMDEMLADPGHYTSGGNMVFVTTYLDGRMLNFAAAMRESGVRVVFFVLTSGQNAPQIPEDIPVYFRLSKWTGGVGYGW